MHRLLTVGVVCFFSQSNSAQTCRVILRTSICWSLMLLIVIQSHSFYLRTMKWTQTQSYPTCISHTTQIHCTEKRDCPLTAPNSHRSSTKAAPSILMQTFEAQTPNPKSGPSLTLLCLWMPACSPSTRRVCCHQPVLPRRPGIRPTWHSPRQKGNRNLQSPHSENGWMAFSTALLSNSPNRLRCGKA